MVAGMTVNWRDYQEMPAIAWGDLLIWKEWEIDQRKKDDTK